MTEMTKYPPGTFSWVELSTTDPASAKKFYGGLFGWDLVDMPAGPDMIYTMAELKGKSVAALFQQSEQETAQGVPPHWNSYVSVASADESAAKAKGLGGTILLDPFDVMDVGRMAVIQDPTGAIFSVWEPKTHIGAQLVNEPGSLSWNELATRDTEKAEKFYTNLFGWSSQVQETPMTVYTTFSNGERMAAGMLKMTEQWGDAPPHWAVYFAVANCDASAEKAKSLGGQIAVPPTDIPPIGRFAVISDPQGAHFYIIKLNNPD